MKLNLDPIENSAQLKNLCDQLHHQEIIAFDTEFIRERTYHPQLALIQLATQEEVWLLDVLAFQNGDLTDLFEILNDPKILKILHSAYGDQECLYTEYKITASPTLDTFEAASLLGYGESVSLRDLIFKTLNIKIPKFLTRTNWLKRPISEEMKRYAMADVQHLVEMGKMLIDKLDKLGRRDWAMELSAQFDKKELYEPNPRELARRLAKSGRISSKSYPIFQDLIAWREERAQKVNIPRRRIADDDTLINIANASPKTEEQLGKFRGINPKEASRQSGRILDIIHRDRSDSDYPIPTPPRISKPTQQQSRVIDFLSTYLKAICQEHKIASRLVFTVKELQKIVVENLRDPKQWVELGLCSPQACQMVGEDLSAVLQGKRGLTVENEKLKILKF